MSAESTGNGDRQEERGRSEKDGKQRENEISANNFKQRENEFSTNTFKQTEETGQNSSLHSLGSASSQPSDIVDTLIIGLVALDSVSTISGTTHMQDSNPGTTKTLVGGVGYNVSVAHKYGLVSQFKDNASRQQSYRFVSAVGDDATGQTVLSLLLHDDISGIAVLPKQTAQYSAILDSHGELVVACADMAIMEDQLLAEHLTAQVLRAQPKVVVVDCNLLSSALQAVFRACASLASPAKVVVEPTSAAKLGRICGSGLSVFPHCEVQLATPTVAELAEIHRKCADVGMFDDFDRWFPVLEALGLDSRFRDRLDVLAAKNSSFRYMMDHGILQQSFQLLPYIPNVLVKLGARGCVLIQLCTNVSDYRSVPTNSQYAPATIYSSGREIDGKVMGAVVQYFPVPNENLQIVDVTGAGDSLVGYLSASLASNDFLTGEIVSLEQEWGKWESVYKAQLASGKSLGCHSAVSSDIANI